VGEADHCVSMNVFHGSAAMYMKGIDYKFKSVNLLEHENVTAANCRLHGVNFLVSTV
jgi:hypothetical protein